MNHQFENERLLLENYDSLQHKFIYHLKKNKRIEISSQKFLVKD